MVRSERCMRRWYLSMGRLSECRLRARRLNVWWLSRWTLWKSQLNHHRFREGSLKLNTLFLEWGNVKLRPSLLIVTLRVYPTLYLSNLYLILNSRVYLSLSLCFLCFYDPRTIWSLLKFHSSHKLIIICVIYIRGLKVRLSTKINAGILEFSRKEMTIGEYTSHVLATCNHVYHHQISQMNLSPS